MKTQEKSTKRTTVSIRSYRTLRSKLEAAEILYETALMERNALKEDLANAQFDYTHIHDLFDEAKEQEERLRKSNRILADRIVALESETVLQHVTRALQGVYETVLYFFRMH